MRFALKYTFFSIRIANFESNTAYDFFLSLILKGIEELQIADFQVRDEGMYRSVHDRPLIIAKTSSHYQPYIADRAGPEDAPLYDFEEKC